MEFTASDIAHLLNGRIDGNPNEKVSQLSKIEEGVPGSVSFLSNPKYLPFIYSTNASIVIVDEGFAPEKKVSSTLVFVPNAQRAFAELLKHYNTIRYSKTGIETPSHLAKSAKFGKDVYIGAFTYVGENSQIADNAKVYPNCYIGDNVSIGEGTIIMPGTRIYSDCVIGKQCFIHSNTVIGSDGFGFTPTGENGKLEKVPQIGNVIIEDDVEIGAACTIDRATLGSTIIRAGAKLDNQIQIAHNVEVGSFSVIASQAGIAGSTKVGKGTQIGGQVGIAGHLQIGNQVRIQAQSGLNKNAPDNTDWYGSPGMDYGEFTRSYVLFRRFPKIVKRLEELEKAFKQIKQSNNVG